MNRDFIEHAAFWANRAYPTPGNEDAWEASLSHPGGLVSTHIRGDQAWVRADHQRGTVFAIRGTDEGTDWVSNVDVRTTPTEVGGQVHYGFYSRARRLWEYVGDDLHNHSSANRPIFLAGHSLGGAVANCLAHVALEYNVRVDGILTLGAPPVGDYVYAMTQEAAYGRKFVRVERCVDPVPHHPRAFYHVGGLHYFDRKDRYSYFKDQKQGRMFRAIDKGLQYSRDVFKRDYSGLDHHSVADYAALVNLHSYEIAKEIH